uniref:Niban apoptosis regulator 1b n=1 Tax=Cyprinus carpio TaxID=7962 RepID=A0A8C2GM63_CYPCA
WSGSFNLIFHVCVGRTEAELKNFSPHYRRQSCVAFFCHLKEEVEQHRAGQAQLLKQKASEVLYEDSMLYFDDNRKWKERFVVVRVDHSLELHDSQESYTKGTPARHKLLPTGGTVLTSEEKYTAVVDKAFPDPSGLKEEPSVPMVAVPGPLPVYLRLPYRRDSYFCFQQEEKRARFVSILNDCIRHQNQDYLKSMECEVQAFLKAIHFYRQEKGHYESWDMLVGTDCQVLANLVMEELLPSLQTELLPKLKGKKADRKRVWFVTVEATYELVHEQLREGLESLKNECREATKQQEALIRSDMDQIINSQTFLETKLQALVSEPAVKYCSESVAPYLTSILEELMGPVSAGFQAVRLLLEDELTRLCKDFPQGGVTEELQSVREHLLIRDNIITHNILAQLMENAVYTFDLLLQSALKDKPDKQASVMEKAKLRVLKQFDYDSSTVRKKIFQDALVDITLPAIKRNLAPACKTELQNFEQFVFADYTNFVQVENVYENILLNLLNNEVNKVVKEAASLKKNNLFADSTDLQCVSQSSLADSRTPPLSAPSSPPQVSASVAVSQQAEQKITSPSRGSVSEDTHKTHDALVIPTVKITPSSPEPTSPLNVSETTQPTLTNNSSPIPEVSETEVSSTKPETILSAGDSSSQPETPSSKAKDEVTGGSSVSTDRAVYLSSTAEETPVPLVIASETLNVEADEESESPPKSEITEESVHNIQPEVNLTINAEVLPEVRVEDTAVDASVCDEHVVVDNKACEEAPSSDENRNETQDSPAVDASPLLDSVPDGLVGGAIALTSAPENQMSAVSTDSQEETADSVQGIRDLIMEVIEVEDVVRPCAENQP